MMCAGGEEMELVRITELAQRLGITSRSLRYYEQVGLIASERPEGEKYRYYAPEAVERLRQILVLRKMQIPVKDILRIYESADMGALVAAFVDKMRAIDGEVAALLELKRVVNEFLEAMLRHGIRRISALPLLYEKMDARLSEMTPTMGELDAAAERITRPLDMSVVDLPAFRAITSVGPDGESDVAGFWAWAAAKGLSGVPGRREAFEFQMEGGESALLLRVPDNFANDGPYREEEFPGGLFATAGAYADEDLAQVHRAMAARIGGGGTYEVDDPPEGGPRRATLIESALSADDLRERLTILVPVRRATPDAARHEKPRAAQISLSEIEKVNPPLRAHEIGLRGVTPILNPRYRVLETGEAEYVSIIDKAVLSTNVPVKIPFRVDYDFSTDEAPVYLYHGRAMAAVNLGDDVNQWSSRDALRCRLPVFGDEAELPMAGRIEKGKYNRLTWIVGEKHFAILVNGEVRYAATDCPYMKLDASMREAHPVIVGANHRFLTRIRSIRVTELAPIPRIRAPRGALLPAALRASNRLPVQHRLVTSHYGENYWFDGCMKYLFECLGRPEFDYWFFSGVTGDNLAQVFSFDRFRGDGASDYLRGPEFAKRIFGVCGYDCEYVDAEALRAEPTRYVRAAMEAVDRGLPVITSQLRQGWKVIVGYERYGRTLLTRSADREEPDAVSADEVADDAWIFVGDKRRDADEAQTYRDVISDMPRLLTVRTEGYCFGPAAFRAWADMIEGGRFNGMREADFDQWRLYNVYVCCLATNGSCREFLVRALQKNPDMTFLADVIKEYELQGKLWEGPGGLESLGGGFNVTLEALQNKEKRTAIAAKIRECADSAERVLAGLTAPHDARPPGSARG